MKKDHLLHAAHSTDADGKTFSLESTGARAVRQRIWDNIQKEGRPFPVGYQVLVAAYIRETSKDLGGGKKLHFVDKTVDEDVYQGKVGLVVDIGADAYQADSLRKFSKPYAKIGDWVFWPAGETISTRTEYGGNVYCFVNDDKIVGLCPDPTLVK